MSLTYHLGCPFVDLRHVKRNDFEKCNVFTQAFHVILLRDLFMVNPVGTNGADETAFRLRQTGDIESLIV